MMTFNPQRPYTTRVRLVLGATLLLSPLPSSSRAQEGGVQAVAQAHEAADAQSTTPAAPVGRHSYDMPAIEGDYSATARVAPSRETERIGEYAQPRWSAFRRFPTTRVYVRPAGTMAFEWWLET